MLSVIYASVIYASVIYASVIYASAIYASVANIPITLSAIMLIVMAPKMTESSKKKKKLHRTI
jgi:hypothetical protein